MAWQLIYTSAPRGLVPGRSGFCTVARHRELRPGLVTAIERFSQYDRSGRSGSVRSPVVFAHRIVQLSGATFHVLSCTRDAGADYTGRTNHLAHHLICEPTELAHAPSPAEVLQQMAWRQTWDEAPRYFGAEEAIDLRGFSHTARLPAQRWQALTRDAGCAALPLESGALAACHWVHAPESSGQELLPLIAESLRLLDPTGRSAEKMWQVPFTTHLQATDHAGDFFWRGCAAGIAAQGARQTLDLTAPHALRAPASEAAELARHGRRAPSEIATLRSAPIAEPEPRAEARPDDLDLEELLASADRKTAPDRAQEKDTAVARRSPLKLLLGAAAALVLCGALALGFVLWRDHHAEQHRSALLAARQKGDFASGPARLAGIGGIFRRYEPLRVEIARTQLAAEFDALQTQTPDDARAWLARNRARLEAPEIATEFQLQDRLAKIKRWLDADTRLEALRPRLSEIDAPTLERELADAEQSIALLDAPYRATLAQRIEAMRTDLATRPTVSLPLPAVTPPTPTPEPPRPAVTPEPVIPKVAAPSVNLGLPTRLTYVAIQSGKNFDVSSVKEMSKWDALPSGETIRLFLQPEPALQPPLERGQDGTVSGGKLYDGGTPLLSLQRPALVAFDDKARARLSPHFGLLFGGASGDFYLHCGEGGERTAALAVLPGRGWLTWDQRSGTVTLREDLVAALARMKYAGGGDARLVLRARGWGDRELSVVPGEGGPLRVDLAPIVQALEREMESARKPANGPRASTWEDRVRAAMAARELLMGKNDDTGLSRLGKELFGLPDDHPLSTVRAYRKDVGSGRDQPLRHGRDYIEYCVAQFHHLAGVVAEAIVAAHERKAPPERMSALNAQKAAVEKVLALFQTELATQNLTQKRCDNVIAIWTSMKPLADIKAPPVQAFRKTWDRLFTPEHIAIIRPLLEWNLTGQLEDGDLDHGFAKLSPKPASTAEAIAERLAALRHQIEADLPALAPFSLDFKLADGTVVRLVNILEATEEADAPR
jgi:hypothetical protein